jgi:hypothetical protein
MEGTRLYEVRSVFLILALTLVCSASTLYSQSSRDSSFFWPPYKPLTELYRQVPNDSVNVWRNDPAQFLEANQFSTIKEILDRSIWLRMGYGKPLVTFPYSNAQIGLEGLVWSRLRILSDFRFPVETADYYFGAFFTWRWSRLRIGHISSHDVDGKDSVFGGSSSHFSREFVEWMLTAPKTANILLSIGFRWYFHQVTKVEDAVVPPISLSIPLLGRGNDALFAAVSTGDGPVFPSYAAGLRWRRQISPDAESGIELMYHYGASWAGTDAGAKVSQLKLQIDVRGL